MSNASFEVRHVVAWLQPARWITGSAVFVLAVVWLFPYLDLSLRGIRDLGLAAAVCRTLIVVMARRSGSATPTLPGLAFASDAVPSSGASPLFLLPSPLDLGRVILWRSRMTSPPTFGRRQRVAAGARSASA
jgi:hypothetical protein